VFGNSKTGDFPGRGTAMRIMMRVAGSCLLLFAAEAVASKKPVKVVNRTATGARELEEITRAARWSSPAAGPT